MICSKCGNKQNVGEKFCPICGTPFSESTSSIKEENKPMTENLETIAKQNCTSESIDENVTEHIKDTEVNMKKNEEILESQTTSNSEWNLKKILLGVLSLLLPIIGVIYFSVKRKKNKAMAKFMLFCAIAGLVLNAVITYCSSDSYSYDDYYESDEYYESEGNSSYESSSNNLWKDYIGKWTYNITLEPDGYSSYAGYGGSIYLTINANGTANLKVTQVNMGREEVVINTSGNIIMDGNTLSISGTSVKFTLSGGTIYTYSGESMNKNYY